MTTADHRLLIDEPLPHVRRFTLNRPEKRNALDHRALEARDAPFGDFRARPGEAGA